MQFRNHDQTFTFRQNSGHGSRSPRHTRMRPPFSSLSIPNGLRNVV